MEDEKIAKMKRIFITITFLLNYADSSAQSEFYYPIKGNTTNIFSFMQSIRGSNDFNYEHVFQTVSYWANYNNNVRGIWEYQFNDSAINEYWFINKDIVINPENYSNCIKAARNTFLEFQKKFGNPLKSIDKTNFSPLDKVNIYNRDILTGEWHDKDETISLDFCIIGEHGEFSFMIRIHRYYKTYFGSQIDRKVKNAR